MPEKTWTCSQCSTEYEIGEAPQLVRQDDDSFSVLCAACAPRTGVRVSFGQDPSSKLTRICDEAMDHIKAHAEYADSMRILILISEEDEEVETEDDETAQNVMLGALNYEDTRLVMSDLVMHIQAAFEAHGMQLRIMPVTPGGSPN